MVMAVQTTEKLQPIITGSHCIPCSCITLNFQNAKISFSVDFITHKKHYVESKYI